MDRFKWSVVIAIGFVIAASINELLNNHEQALVLGVIAIAVAVLSLHDR